MTTIDFSSDVFFRLPSNSRYEEVIKHLKRGKSIFALADAEGCLIIDLGSDKVLPIWPTAELATEWGTKDYPDFQAMEIAARDWADKWLTGMQNDGFCVGVASNLAGECIVSSAQEHQHDIQSPIK
ncbi:DUF2750 domain-containing protein [Marinomonas pollencensis]|uniref:Uncharacterized protein DUF2750 n=1 Tax=Marinomonas pollencensis TaxID=491954 RepID=A0A3E0DP57_9GAMM|nr:DUF2750 domain-containing protein [Marinomonas pollencensis]REG83258.1 uncharacterized protein DUF2750 [Marinomonas pollencensis]